MADVELEQDLEHHFLRAQQLHANLDNISFEHNEFNFVGASAGDQGTDIFRRPQSRRQQDFSKTQPWKPFLHNPSICQEG
jgi:hypothetical protein